MPGQLEELRRGRVWVNQVCAHGSGAHGSELTSIIADASSQIDRFRNGTDSLSTSVTYIGATESSRPAGAGRTVVRPQRPVPARGCPEPPVAGENRHRRRARFGAPRGDRTPRGL